VKVGLESWSVVGRAFIVFDPRVLRYSKARLAQLAAAHFHDIVMPLHFLLFDESLLLLSFVGKGVRSVESCLVYNVRERTNQVRPYPSGELRRHLEAVLENRCWEELNWHRC